VIDRAGAWDGDAVPAARNRPADLERGDASSIDSPTPADAPAAGGRTDAVLATPEQRAAAHCLYRDSVDHTYVDHTYDMTRIEAGEDAGSQHSHDPQPRDASEGGATRDADAEPAAHGEAADAEAPDAVDTRARDADSEPRETEAPEAEDTEAEDTEARDAWAEALPGLRAAWEEHEQRFPERSRSASSSEADGGWLADGGRRLTPEQNADAGKACEDIRTEGREVIRPAMERVEAADPARRHPPGRRNRGAPGRG
jgi:hypothetical protein